MNCLQIQLSMKHYFFFTYIELVTGYEEINTEIWSLCCRDYNSVENKKKKKNKREYVKIEKKKKNSNQSKT